MVPYVIKKLPINEDQVYKALFPRVDIADEPDKLIQQKLVIINTRFRNISHFFKLTYELLARGIPTGLVTDLPFTLSEKDLQFLKPFHFCLFFDQYTLVTYPFAKQAAWNAIEMVCKSDLTLIPKIGAVSYLEMKISEETLPHMSLALTFGEEAFVFCDLIVRKSKSLNYFKSLITCPRHLEIKAQEAAHYPVVLEEECSNIKVTRHYWLDEDELLDQVENYKESMNRIKQFLSI